MARGKALRKGSTCPPHKDENKLRIYSMRYCPFAQRVLLVLNHKSIPYEEVNIHLQDKPDWYLAKNPLGKVPALEQKDTLIYESLVCADYLDEVYPGPKLTPTDPYVKALHRMLVEHFSKVISGFYALLREEELEETVKTLYGNLQYFEDNLKSAFFGGDSVQMVDFSMWPWLERLCAVPEITQNKFNFDKFPKLKQYCAEMKDLEAVKAIQVDHLLAFKSHKTGQFNPDVGLEE